MKKIIIVILLSFSCVFAVTNQQIMFANTLSAGNSQPEPRLQQAKISNNSSFADNEAKIISLMQIKRQIISLRKELPELKKQCRNNNDTNFLMTGFPTVNNSSVINMGNGGGSCEQVRQIESALRQLINIYNGQLQ